MSFKSQLKKGGRTSQMPIFGGFEDQIKPQHGNFKVSLFTKYVS